MNPSSKTSKEQVITSASARKNGSSSSFVQAFLKDGSSVQYRVASLLKKNGWDVKLEQAYIDDSEARVRQCDIVASKKIAKGKITVKLIIECKYVKDGHIIFLSDDVGDYCSRVEDRSVSIRTGSNKIKEHFEKNAINKHHYCNPVCLSSTSLARERDGDVFKKMDKDVIFEAVCQVVKPMIDQSKREYTDTVTYLVVVIGSAELYTCPISALPTLQSLVCEGIPPIFEPKGRLCLEYSYSINHGRKPSTLIIDILREENLEEYLNDTIQPEIRELELYQEGLTWEQERQGRRGELHEGGPGNFSVI